MDDAVAKALHAVRHHLAGGGFLSDLFSGPDIMSTGSAPSPGDWGNPELASDFFKADKAMRLAQQIQAAEPDRDTPLPPRRPAPEAAPRQQIASPPPAPTTEPAPAQPQFRLTAEPLIGPYDFGQRLAGRQFREAPPHLAETPGFGQSMLDGNKYADMQPEVPTSQLQKYTLPEAALVPPAPEAEINRAVSLAQNIAPAQQETIPSAADALAAVEKLHNAGVYSGEALDKAGEILAAHNRAMFDSIPVEEALRLNRAAGPMMINQGMPREERPAVQPLAYTAAPTPAPAQAAINTATTPTTGKLTARVDPNSDAERANNVWNRMLIQESGGRQFDRNGNTITSPVGALGISQVMPSTGPEAAQLAGLPWSLERLRTDPEYNHALGRAYYEAQLERFGDPTLAAAAYNGGPGRVASALRQARETGRPWTAFLRPETQNYVRVVTAQPRASGGSVDDALRVVREHHADGEAVGQAPEMPAEEPRPLTIYRGNAPVADEAGGSGRDAVPAFSYMPMPESVERQAARQPAYNPAERTWSDAGSTEGERLTRALGVEGELPKGETTMSAAPTGWEKYMPQRRPGSYMKRWGEAFNENADAIEEGLKAVRGGNYGSGALGMAGGAFGMLMSPLTGMERVLVRDPYLRITGNLKDAQAAEMVADTALTGGIRSMVKPFAKAGNLEKLAAEPVTSAYRLPSPAMTGAATAAGAMLAPEDAEAAKLSKLLRVVSPEDAMMLVHNLKSHRLADIEKLGGLPVPSTAIIKPSQGFTNFGDITMVAPKEMAQPSRTNPTFAADAHTPRFPATDDAGERIFKGFTPSGTRRYSPLTLENAVKEMKGNIRGGEGFDYGAGTIRAGVAPQFKSIKEIQNARDLIKPREEMQGAFDLANEKLNALAEKYYPHYNYGGDQWTHMKDFSDMLREAGMGKWGELRKTYKSSLPPELYGETTDFLNYLKQLPTEYFEGKPQRAVRLNEFRGAVVPGDIAGEQADILRRMGVERLEQYDPNSPASRIEALQKFGGEQFAEGGSVEDRALMLISQQA